MTRIAQDYIYTSSSTDLLSSLLENMLLAYQMEETPAETKEGILTVSALFFKRVSSSFWKDHFREIYDSFDFSDNDTHRRSQNPIYGFFLDGVKLIEDDAFRIKIVDRCLKKMGSFDHYDNLLIVNAVVKKHVKLNSTILTLVDQFIEVSETSAHFYALINLFEKLKKNQREKILIKLSGLDYLKYQNEIQLLTVICRFSEHIPLVGEKIKTIMLYSPRLWSTGIGTDGSVSHFTDDININTVQNYIHFSVEEVFLIYSKLEQSLNKIIKHREQHKVWFLFHWKKLIMQMSEFLLNNHEILSEDLNYKSVEKEVEQALLGEFALTTIDEALSAEKANIVSSGLQLLFNNVYRLKKDLKQYQTEYLVIITRIILKKRPGIQTCFEHVSWALNEYSEKFDQSLFHPLLKEVLNKYQCDFSWQNNKLWELPAEKEVIEKCLQDLYHTYRNWGETIPFWENYKPAFFPATED